MWQPCTQGVNGALNACPRDHDSHPTQPYRPDSGTVALITLGGHQDLTREAVEAVAWGGERLALAPEALERVAAGRAELLALLAGGARTADERQRTLRATVEWSFRLLEEPDRRLFRRLAVFAGGFTNIIDIAFDKRGRLYVLEIATNGLLSAGENELPVGRLVRVNRDGSRTTLASEGLNAPGGFVLGHGAAYITNNSILSDAGQVVKVAI